MCGRESVSVCVISRETDGRFQTICCCVIAVETKTEKESPKVSESRKSVISVDCFFPADVFRIFGDVH